MYTTSAPYYDAIYRAMGKDYPAEAETIREIVESRKPGARTLLDVACGTGLHLEELARWYQVEGVDVSEDMLSIARTRLPDVPLHRADMTELDLGRTFDAVTCLFSSIGFMVTKDRLNLAAVRLAQHVAPGGVLLVEPWYSPAAWRPRTVHMQVVDEPDLKIARLTRSEVDGTIARTPMHYLVATPEGVEHFFEPHDLGLFEDEEYLDAFASAGLDVEYFEDVGLAGRGLYLGTRPATG